MMECIRCFLRGVLEAAGIVTLFVAGGLCFAAALAGDKFPAGAPAPYLGPAVEPQHPAAPPPVWLVDGYNVLQVGLLAGRRLRPGVGGEGWWTAPFRDELLGRVAAFEDELAEIWVVFDGAISAGTEHAGRVRSVFAPSADEWLLAQIRERDPARVTLVTADRPLAARARHRGAQVVAPSAFLARCRVTT